MKVTVRLIIRQGPSRIRREELLGSEDRILQYRMLEKAIILNDISLIT